jgi:four helix bundle protein
LGEIDGIAQNWVIGGDLRFGTVDAIRTPHGITSRRAEGPDRGIADFISKIGLVVEEADESLGWLQMLVDNQLLAVTDAAPAIQEADELTAIFSASLRTAKKNAAIEKENQKAGTRRSRTRKPQ